MENTEIGAILSGKKKLDKNWKSVFQWLLPG